MKKREIPKNIESDFKPLKYTSWCLDKYHYAKRWWHKDNGHFNESLYFRIVQVKQINS